MIGTCEMRNLCAVEHRVAWSTTRLYVGDREGFRYVVFLRFKEICLPKTRLLYYLHSRLTKIFIDISTSEPI